MLCNKCRGAGHRASECPSSDKYRSYAYMIGLLQAAKDRADARGTPGGRRASQRGQVGPFRPNHPRTFSPRSRSGTAPYRQFLPARGRSAEENPDADNAEEDGERGGAARLQPARAAVGAESEDATRASPEAAPATEAPTASQQQPPGHPMTASFAGLRSYYDRMDARGRQGPDRPRDANVTGRSATTVEPVQGDTEEEPTVPEKEKGRMRRTLLPAWALPLGLLMLGLGALLAAGALYETGSGETVAVAAGASVTVAWWPRAVLRAARESVAAAAALPPAALVMVCALCFLAGRIGATPVQGPAVIQAPPTLSTVLDMSRLVRTDDHNFTEILPCRSAFERAATSALIDENPTLGSNPQIWEIWRQTSPNLAPAPPRDEQYGRRYREPVRERD